MIESLRAAYDPAILLIASGLVVGLLFGIIAEVTAFCTRAAIVETIDARPGAPRIRLTQYLAALLVAVVATQWLALSGTVDIAKSLYWSVPVNVVTLVVGGLAFGVGMILANGCPGRHLVLLATGSARSLLTLTVIGLAAYATQRGLLAYPRIGLEGLAPKLTPAVGLPELIGVPQIALAVGLSAGLAGAVVWFGRRAGLAAVARGLAVGAVIGLGWWATGYVAADEFGASARPASISFTAPIGETIMFAMIATGESFKFPVALVVGVIGGALVSALVGGRFKARGFPTEFGVVRYGIGALLMGFGAVLALGCNMGQALTGLSTLATGSVIATVAIVAGAWGTIVVERRLAEGPVVRRTAAPSVSGGDAVRVAPAE
jgi:uncharacterized membrane protein YedE/YeeE